MGWPLSRLLVMWKAQRFTPPPPTQKQGMCLSLSASDDLKSMRVKRAKLSSVCSAKRRSLHDGVPLKRTLKSSCGEILSAISIGSHEKSPKSSTTEIPPPTHPLQRVYQSPAREQKKRRRRISDERSEDPQAARVNTQSKKFHGVFVVVSDANKFIPCSFCSHRPSFTCR